MKLTKSQLKQIIKEELEMVLNEANPDPVQDSWAHIMKNLSLATGEDAKMNTASFEVANREFPDLHTAMTEKYGKSISGIPELSEVERMIRSLWELVGDASKAIRNERWDDIPDSGWFHQLMSKLNDFFTKDNIPKREF